MAVLADVKHGTGQVASEGRASWPVFLLTLAAVTSSSLSALSLYQLVDLRAEVERLKTDISRMREEGQKVTRRDQTENNKGRENIKELWDLPESQKAFSQIRRRRTTSGSEIAGSVSCLQLLANNSRKPFRKGIPWQTGLRRGSSLETDGDRIVVNEAGFYFVYSQVYYMDSTFTMGHVVIRWKRHVVGNEDQDVHLFRCIQSMNPDYSFNTCYTGGIVKLEKGDYLELLIPRSMANISMEGDSTFLGAFKLA
ncbi:tumor necrosis factor ligand superfamily member 13B isoform X2 [Poeciliopsis prolifica]|uniref:tumor necrosis factor ligand superfamily member 13B isoform X2 n=1 Tax=Poeciliopsis prolifica TaxID=188132 RepID=UPI002412F5C3|nr:tumor necrosis factor ligand superfamily member 13B isoform X2 [Poeciliopsis prolifica]